MKFNYFFFSGEESDSDTDSEEKTTRQITVELAELTSDIDMKQRLIEELENSQRRLEWMKQHYEEKLSQLQTRIKATQEERDKVLATFSKCHTCFHIIPFFFIYFFYGYGLC